MNYNKIWYEDLNKSQLTPPSFLFGIVWPILYTSLGVSFYLAWRNEKCFPFCNALVVFLIQFLFNINWSRIFFKNQDIQSALHTVIYMIIFTILSIYKFYKINKLSAFLQVPYLLWISFAAYLNWYIYKNN